MTGSANIVKILARDAYVMPVYVLRKLNLTFPLFFSHHISSVSLTYSDISLQFFDMDSGSFCVISRRGSIEKPSGNDLFKVRILLNLRGILETKAPTMSQFEQNYPNSLIDMDELPGPVDAIDTLADDPFSRSDISVGARRERRLAVK
ncbi:hypothetical protein CVT25_002984 [Psilocybe cyanescens]|uniref:Uncharacterized protein n=1 Tax=Psilocybe cyanescens TaxID=93625 RepID=A0A409WMV8_PSICY|nr:hypothetical protein CVT25_002984 [Psilocybe cyanescens]